MTERLSFIDIETTGANSEGNKITEIAIINVDDGVVVSEWVSLINPECRIPWNITKLTGITDEMVAGAPRFFEVAKKIIEFTEGRIFVAHNVFFDYRFVQREFQDLGYTYRRDVMCTLRLSRLHLKGHRSYSLSNLSRDLGIPREAHHRALDDTRASLEVYRRIKAQGQKLEVKSPLLPGKLDEAQIEKLPTGAGTYFFYSESGALLYVGKANSIRGRVRQHFQGAPASKREQDLKDLTVRIEAKVWGSELAAGLMELQLIKTLRPLMNRASRKIRFRYTLLLHEKAEPGEEVRLTSLKDDQGMARWGSKPRALQALAEVYKEAFGFDVGDLFFRDKMRQLRSTLGEDYVFERLKEKMPQNILPFEADIELSGRKRGERAFVACRQGRLREIQFVDEQGEVEIHPLDDFPDMHRLVRRYLDATGSPNRSGPSPESSWSDFDQSTPDT